MPASWDWNIFEYLKLGGDGSIDATGDHSGTDGEYSWTASGGTAEIHRMIVHLEDTFGFAASGYGDGSDLGSGTGLRLVLRDSSDNEQYDILGGQEIRTNSDWAGICYDTAVSDYGSGNDYLTARFTFANSGSPLVIPSGSSLVLIVRADMQFLVKHRFFLQGHYRHSDLGNVTF